MILNTEQQPIESNTPSAKQLTIANNSIIMELLTSKLYANPLESVLREYASNAIDACTVVNKPVNYEVHFPTYDSEILSFRDYGVGMDKETLQGIFLVIGKVRKETQIPKLELLV